VKALVVALCVVAVAAPAASAKGRITIDAPRTARAGKAFVVTVTTGWVVPRNDWLRLISVAPGKSWYDVVGSVTGDSKLAHARIPNDGFEIHLARVAARRWRAAVKLPRAGTWRLVVPNYGHAGFLVDPPPPMVSVRVAG
jgi:hypothetical protein